MTKMSMTLVAAAIVVTGIVAAAVPGAASPVPVLKVGPNQAFVGLVNGHTGQASVDVICPGPLRINQTGHPAAGQTVGVASPSAISAVIGFTGSKAHTIVANLVAPATTTAGLSLTFAHYGNQSIPTTILLPCYGISTVLFVPRPTSPTARNDQVKVSFVATCGSPVCPVDRR